MCSNCRSPSVFYKNPSEALNLPELPSRPLCFACVLEKQGEEIGREI